MKIPQGLTRGQTLTAVREGGIVNQAYWDPIGKVWTVGIGCTGDDIISGTYWTDDQAVTEFLDRYSIAEAQARIDLGNAYWANFNEVRQAAFTDIAYQDGGQGLADFKRMIAAARLDDWLTTKNECLNSLNEKQTPTRCQENAEMLYGGEWPS